MLKPQVLVEDYQQEYGCITVAELQWLLRRCGRHSAYYTFFLLRVTTGIRGHELLNVQLAQFRDNFTTLIYRVDKPKVKQNRHGELQETRKIRTVKLDPWVASEVIAYCERHMVIQPHADGSHSYLSPHNLRGRVGLMFPWKGPEIVLAYWNKLRHKAVAAGFDANRLERQYVRLEPSARIMDDKTYVWRPHMLRHFAATVMSWKLGSGFAPDHKAVQKWLCHSDADTTWKYVHAASELGVTGEYLRSSSWASICGFDAAIPSLLVRDATQTVLNIFGE